MVNTMSLLFITSTATMIRWSLALFSINVGQPWVFIGTMFNTAIMIQVTNLTEARMLADTKRNQLFRKYQQETSVWFPMPSRASKAKAA
jgi:steroid 5-alpha reductase family enzyme